MTELPTLAAFLDGGSDPALALGADLWDELLDLAEEAAYWGSEAREPRYELYAQWMDSIPTESLAGLVAKWAVECEENPSLVWRLALIDNDPDFLARLSDAGIAPPQVRH